MGCKVTAKIMACLTCCAMGQPATALDPTEEVYHCEGRYRLGCTPPDANGKQICVDGGIAMGERYTFDLKLIFVTPWNRGVIATKTHMPDGLLTLDLGNGAKVRLRSIPTKYASYSTDPTAYRILDCKP